MRYEEEGLGAAEIGRCMGDDGVFVYGRPSMVEVYLVDMLIEVTG